MTAGLRQKVNIYRPVAQADDAVGGAVMTDTTLHSNVPAAVLTRRPSQLSLESGLEVPTTYDLTLRPGISVRERDEVEVVFPADDSLLGVRLRIVGVQPGKRRRGRAAVHASMIRVYHSRTEA